MFESRESAKHSKKNIRKNGTFQPQKDLRNFDIRKFTSMNSHKNVDEQKQTDRNENQGQQSNRSNKCGYIPQYSSIAGTQKQSAIFSELRSGQLRQKQLRITDSRLKIHIPHDRLGIFNFEPEDPDEFLKKLEEKSIRENKGSNKGAKSQIPKKAKKINSKIYGTKNTSNMMSAQIAQRKKLSKNQRDDIFQGGVKRNVNKNSDNLGQKKRNGDSKQKQTKIDFFYKKNGLNSKNIAFGEINQQNEQEKHSIEEQMIEKEEQLKKEEKFGSGKTFIYSQKMERQRMGFQQQNIQIQIRNNNNNFK